MYLALHARLLAAHVGALFHLAKKAGEGVRQARPGPAALPAPLAA